MIPNEFKRRLGMAPKWFLMILVISAAFSLGCDIETPEIRGVVLDAETKQAVEGAWIMATLGIRTRTVAGDTHRYLVVEVPHTRTGKNGRFVIPAKTFDSPPFPFGFGTDVESFGIGASTVDDRGGDVSLKEPFNQDKIEVEIYIKPEERTGKEYCNHLQALFNYCETGRFFVEVPAVKGGSDDWELDYAIAKHERFLRKFGDPMTIDQETCYVGASKDLGYLYKKKREYKKALEIFTIVKQFDEKRKVNLWLKQYEIQIEELKGLINK
ncbi:MAG: hypothetical protein NTY64_22325 [Deltaproteobacteria bacterium]|nr:hypothetical protein [Deltaproteobacteria bacterium]